MLRRSARSLATALGSALPVHRDTTRKPTMSTEVGNWLYRKETMQEFNRWCRAHQVRAYGNVKMTSTIHFARCLRLTKSIAPGEAIVTAPLSACFNFLVVAREMFDSSNSTFPLQLNWMNYNERLSFMKSASICEFAQAGWMGRIASLEESPFAPYVRYLMEDTRGREGISNGMAREREEESGMLDHYLSEMATDACEEPEVFLEHFFRGLACLHLRSQPIEAEAVQYFMPGTNFFKVKASEMYVPTLVPLVDAVPQLEDGNHNTVVEYFPYKDVETLRSQCTELGIRFFEKGKEAPIVTEEAPSGQGVMQKINVEHELMDPALLRGGGFVALRALRPLEEGDVLYLRRFPDSLNRADQRKIDAQMMDANRLLSRDN
ncbi:putative mitochondrial hypothetical protein [Leptomonas pyrrhocoris]|uniref:SET domain-containing protein n=1 Tax=Leptomonas pyrrhocoris TaxID=157538 RepID=A0A0M9G7M7_LEPPY|nr:putative mitochondrial hypothetical protein [Leptomonas pyrrhocoris]XP_015662675.1 putative mitochondrial hypothetical protein [Leptomonas pyrrhocoris]XP_015662676.1 putative mitochondrial hypothetical protein [Leptomonas pyrrhocoris]XP_015662677.1 putative mitochondrial hypothetical protein [Leptomonas pyrrhocoris]KPA84235.1 putative mitochondrial hypothetical protein [Leptomonas pyrrhocoris]KPA84236.1 putative mitochondrial hypothetical protein [Leptomonas pyrrhocoris]KPA84237.1 putative|eukprot:XP_015662674.1 putative mitochondrial hypothetical protein [Leptomonas pyrrhocoris]